MATNNHGGRREGAGKPAPHGAKRMYAVRLPRDMIAWLRGQPESQATLIERALRQTYNLPSEPNDER